jgi:hypothetical protein
VLALPENPREDNNSPEPSRKASDPLFVLRLYGKSSAYTLNMETHER